MATHGDRQPEIEKLKLIEYLNATASSRQIAEAIERLAVSADAKSLLMDMSRVTIKLGDAIISLGGVVAELWLRRIHSVHPCG